jgi:Predicted Zn-dependent protease (DUF2268)
MRCLSVLLAISAFAQTEPPRVTIVTSDIDNFWKAYDASTPGDREDAFHKLYLGPASLGLRDFFEKRILSARLLALEVDKDAPKFYAAIRANTMQVEKQKPAILKYLARYAELYPDAKFPPVYFVIGRLTSGGTVSNRGLLIGTEVYSKGPGVDTSEINPPFVRAMGTIDRIPLIVVHELTHTQQKQGGTAKVPKLLAQCIGEGAADFMTELVAGSTINAYAKEWADARHDELFQRLARDIAANPNDSSHWIYNYDKSGDEPADLGYWIGAEICRSYYEKATDKSQAIADIVKLADTEKVVRGSAYSSLLPPR